ncbi:hypothetical protein [Chryseobacterium sp. c4a]|uniref:hypothetical protein n=1 Tax=Chryseobacterium sp. c4a TaxID=1573582 RepID=UPI00135ACA66|nr:hypothetical protein [Chryseobacterium sp. c4a]
MNTIQIEGMNTKQVGYQQNKQSQYHTENIRVHPTINPLFIIYFDHCFNLGLKVAAARSSRYVERPCNKNHGKHNINRYEIILHLV